MFYNELGLTFDGTDDYFKLSDSTIPANNEEYTVVGVILADQNHSGGILGSGDHSVQGSANSFMFSNVSDTDNSTAGLKDSWAGLDYNSSDDLIDFNQNNIITFRYDSNVRDIYYNGMVDVSAFYSDGVTSSNIRSSLDINNFLGKANDFYLDGNIVELLVLILISISLYMNCIIIYL